MDIKLLSLEQKSFSCHMYLYINICMSIHGNMYPLCVDIIFCMHYMYDGAGLLHYVLAPFSVPEPM